MAADPRLGGPVTPVGPGNVAVGGQLALDIGWDLFEQLVAAVAKDVLGLGQTRFRRYGSPGQAQFGIDIAGRRPDGGYTVIQCKQVAAFTAANLTDAVETFGSGRRPFDADTFVLAVTHPNTRTTGVLDELGILEPRYSSQFRIELWGPFS